MWTVFNTNVSLVGEDKRFIDQHVVQNDQLKCEPAYIIIYKLRSKDFPEKQPQEVRNAIDN